MSFKDIMIGHADRIDWTEKFREHYRGLSEEEQTALIEALRKAVRPTHNCPLCSLPMKHWRELEVDETLFSKEQWTCVSEDCPVASVDVLTHKKKVT
ncbi:hypothetical protein LCGC14_2134060 [marine sediment metagenome]|uniref:Uncharacterized protein n=1 Tax=marine sediment metagenome TaxID=412755 RepID=A0A0F9GDJ1_9ZZZZ